MDSKELLEQTKQSETPLIQTERNDLRDSNKFNLSKS